MQPSKLVSGGNPWAYVAGAAAVAGLAALGVLYNIGVIGKPPSIPNPVYPIKPAAVATATPTQQPTKTPEPEKTPALPSIRDYWESITGGKLGVRVEVVDCAPVDENKNGICDDADYYGREVYRRYEELPSVPQTQLKVVVDKNSKALGGDGTYSIYDNPPVTLVDGRQRYLDGSTYTLRHFNDKESSRVGEDAVRHETDHWRNGSHYSTEDWFEEIMPTYLGNLSIFMKEGGKKEDFKFVEWNLKHSTGGDMRLFKPTSEYVQLLLSRPQEPVTEHVPAMSLIGSLEKSYNFDFGKFADLDQKLQEKINEKGAKLTRAEIRQVVEGVAGGTVETFDILEPWMNLHSTDANKVSRALNRILELYPDLNSSAYKQTFLEQSA